MPSKKLPYKEGDWFAVPLYNGGYGLGVVARLNGKGVVAGYFFGLQHRQLPTLEETTGLAPIDAALVGLFGDLGLLQGEWPIIGSSNPWRRGIWALPVFARISQDGSRALRIEHSEADINEIIRETPMGVREARLLPDGGLFGSGALEIRLTMLLCE